MPILPTNPRLKNSFMLLPCSLALVVFVSACMTYDYPKFLSELKKRCPTSYQFQESRLNDTEVSEICSCIEKTTQEKWPDIKTLHQALHDHDREPRGDADFILGTIRMTLPSCTTKEL